MQMMDFHPYRTMGTGRAPSHHRLNSIFKLPFSWDEMGHAPSLLLGISFNLCWRNIS